ncbi:enoyl-CoA hydratase/isomerase family protein [Auritidibacter ignavus]|uniref:enoyl-CoA hydratase/isomerase family protein n=1 Tax=Auritidibacter ignavus TaxID=678932 RepID=UPI000D73BB13|nr:enoyl-CoA hydratase/isomerase family protein [Auritidibacter ignavus]PXA78535.1 crotonase [Auritidibacter sp. NML120779]WGH82229.1 enoyl-CoA hydratase/isomerase family protein [Auritidibacter ignavus]
MTTINRAFYDPSGGDDQSAQAHSTRIAEIVLDGATSRNALDLTALIALQEHLDSLVPLIETGEVRVLILRGEGTVFCSGRDISEVSVDADDAYEFLNNGFWPVFDTIRSLSIPVISVVQGAALGLGYGLATAADVIYSAENAKFGSPFAAIGAILDSGAHAVFLDRLGYHRTMDLIFTGDFITGVEAATIGLVSRAVPADQLLHFAREKATQIALGPVETFKAEKRFTGSLSDERLRLGQVWDTEALLQERARASDDYREGFTAFQQRRKPSFD